MEADGWSGSCCCIDRPYIILYISTLTLSEPPQGFWVDWGHHSGQRSNLRHIHATLLAFIAYKTTFAHDKSLTLPTSNFSYQDGLSENKFGAWCMNTKFGCVLLRLGLYLSDWWPLWDLVCIPPSTSSSLITSTRSILQRCFLGLVWSALIKCHPPSVSWAH